MTFIFPDFFVSAGKLIFLIYEILVYFLVDYFIYFFILFFFFLGYAVPMCSHFYM